MMKRLPDNLFFHIGALIALILGACRPLEAPAAAQETAGTASEVAIQQIVLSGVAARSSQQYSGMTWNGDTLVLLPQYPARLLYGIDKATLLAALAGEITEIEPFQIAFDAGIIQIAAFQGYEAIAFDGDQVYLTVEAGAFGFMRSYLLTGTVAEDGAISIRGSEPLDIPQPARISNAAHETLLMIDDQILAIYERNGRQETVSSSAQLIQPDRTMEAIEMPPIPYRVTDATAADNEGRFWVMNYFYPGETRPDRNDPVPLYSGLETHEQYRHLERLVEMQFSAEDGIRITDTPPIYLQLEADPRNWEGIVRLDDLGFLLITDTHPQTILAFVPFPAE